MKALILGAGKGTRLYPVTHSFPKPLLPVANKSMLQYSIEKLTQHEITEIGIVINPSHELLLKEWIGFGDTWDVKITYIFQNKPKGIAHAVKEAQDFIGDDVFLLLLGDNLIFDTLSGLITPITTKEYHAAVMLAEVKTPQDYGIVELVDDKIVSLEEKPMQPKSNLAVLGAYAFSPTIFNAISAIKPSARGELEITDAIRWMIAKGYNVTHFITEKPNIDVGTMERWHKANCMVLDEVNPKDYIHETVVLDNCQINPPVLVGHDCSLKDCVIGPYVSIGPGSTINGCHLEHSIILNDTYLKHIENPVKNKVIGYKSIIVSLD